MGGYEWRTSLDSPDGGLGAGRGFCLECGEDFVYLEDEDMHAPWCSRSRSGAKRPKPRPVVRTSPDPNLYVWTERGFERARDVERRRNKQR